MSDLIVFQVRRRPGGWTVEGGRWISAIMPKADALDLAHGMAQVIREVGQPAQVLIVDDQDDSGAASP